MTVNEHDLAKMIAEIEATSWRLRETIRVRELAATHRLGKMRRLLMLEEHKTWKREFGFDRMETAAEMDEKCSRTSTSPFPDPSFFRNMIIPRHPHTPAEFTLEMKVDVKGLRMEIILSQPAPPQNEPLPRRAAVDTGSEKLGTPPQSPAIGTESDGPGVMRIETSRKEEGLRSLGTSMDSFFNFTGTEQECILFKSDVGVDDNDESTTPKVQAGAHEEFARLPIGRHQRETASTQQSKQSDRGRSQRTITFLKREKYFWRISVYLLVAFPLVLCLLSACVFSCHVRNNCRSRYEKR